MIVEDPDPPSGEIAGFTMTSLGRGIGRIAWPRTFIGQFREDDREIWSGVTEGDLHYSVTLSLPGETEPEAKRACDEIFMRRPGKEYKEIHISYELERREDFRVGPYDACEVEVVSRSDEGVSRSAHRIIVAGDWTIHLSVNVQVDSAGTPPANWGPKAWFGTLELPDSMPRSYANPGCVIHIGERGLSAEEQEALEADVATLPRPADMAEPVVAGIRPEVLGIRLGGMTESELRPLLEQFDARLAGRGLRVGISGCGALDRAWPRD